MLSILLIGVSLSMDALAISITNGMTLKDFSLRHALWMGLYFGGFQFLMPLLGCLLGSAVSGYVSAFGPYISFFLLAFIGGKMLLDSLRPAKNDEDEDSSGMTRLSHSRLLLMAIATSIDALAVGVTFAFLEVAIVPAVSFIGITTFIFSAAGVLIGNIFGAKWKNKAEFAGGAILILIGLKILIEHLAG